MRQADCLTLKCAVMKKQNLALLVVVRSANKSGMAKTYIRITIDGNETECYLGQIVPKEHWNNDLKRCEETFLEFQTINDQIEDALNEIRAHFIVLSKTNAFLTPEEIKSAYLGLSNSHSGINYQVGNNNQPATLLQITDEFIEDFEDQVKEGIRSEETLKQWRATRKKIVEFAKFHFRKNDIKLIEIDPSFGECLYRYLTLKRSAFLKDETNKRRSSNLGEAAAKKQIKNIKQLIAIGVDKSIISKNPWEKFKTSGGEKEVHPLELQEVLTIHSKKMPIDRLDEVRDLYIFQCFTGFAYKDLFQLSREHIVYVGLGQEPWLMKERGKTKVTEMVPLLPIALEIIEKYKKHPYCENTGKLLPINSNSNYNGYLKEIATICGINRNLKTHLARHTFADIMLNVCNIPMEDVSKMLGHKSLRTTARYCRVRKERISRNMKAVNELLFDEKGKLKLKRIA